MNRAVPRKTLLALFATAFGITLLVTAPASLLGAYLSKKVHGTIQFASSQGTIWSGTATPVLRLSQGNPIPLERIGWEIRFAPLLHGSIGLELKQESSGKTRLSEIDAGIRGIKIQQLSIALPAEVLGAIHPLLLAMHPQGAMTISGNDLEISTHSMHGSATAQWLSAGSAISTVNPFGSYQINLNASSNQIAIKLSTITGPLMLDGKGNWSVAGGLLLDAHAKSAPESRDALAELMHHLGPEVSPGVRLIRIGGAI